MAGASPPPTRAPPSTIISKRTRLGALLAACAGETADVPPEEPEATEVNVVPETNNATPKMAVIQNLRGR